MLQDACKVRVKSRICPVYISDVNPFHQYQYLIDFVWIACHRDSDPPAAVCSTVWQIAILSRNRTGNVLGGVLGEANRSEHIDGAPNFRGKRKTLWTRNHAEIMHVAAIAFLSILQTHRKGPRLFDPRSPLWTYLCSIIAFSYFLLCVWYKWAVFDALLAIWMSSQEPNLSNSYWFYYSTVSL